MAFQSTKLFLFATALQFYWQSSLLANKRDSQSLLFGYQPYSPQCDAFGQWLPSQCHPSTGKTSLLLCTILYLLVLCLYVISHLPNR